MIRRIAEAKRPKEGRPSAPLAGRLPLVFAAVLAVSLLLVGSLLVHSDVLSFDRRGLAQGEGQDFLAQAAAATQAPAAATVRTTPGEHSHLRASWRELMRIKGEKLAEKDREGDAACMPPAAHGMCSRNWSMLEGCQKSCSFFLFCELCDAKLWTVPGCKVCVTAHAKQGECKRDPSELGGVSRRGGTQLQPSFVDQRFYLPNTSSVILEVGGNVGGDLGAFVRLFPEAKVFSCEPVPVFFKKLQDTYGSEPNVSLFNFGVAEKDTNTTFVIAGLGGQGSSGLTGEKGERVAVFLRDISSVLRQVEEAAGAPPDAVSINCEGCEYLTLQRIVDTGWLPRLAFLQFSWHIIDGVPDRVAKRCQLERSLEMTHELTWFDPFYGWQGWRRRAEPEGALASPVAPNASGADAGPGSLPAPSSTRPL